MTWDGPAPLSRPPAWAISPPGRPIHQQSPPSPSDPCPSNYLLSSGSCVSILGWMWLQAHVPWWSRRVQGAAGSCSSCSWTLQPVRLPTLLPGCPPAGYSTGDVGVCMYMASALGTLHPSQACPQLTCSCLPATIIRATCDIKATWHLGKMDRGCLGGLSALSWSIC